MRSARHAALAAALVLLTAGGTAIVVAGAANAAKPSGAVTTLQQYGSGIRATGWADDPDLATPSSVYLRVDGVRKAHAIAKLYDPASRTNRGYDLRVAVPAGTHRVCVTTPDYPKGALVTLGCRTMTLDYDPIGALDSPVQLPGKVTVSGWTIDRDSATTALTVAVRIDGVTKATVTANAAYPGLHLKHPIAGDDHGFRASVPVTEGSHLICARATNVGAGDDAFFCVRRTISFSPYGGIRTVSQLPGGLHIEGYARDPDTTATTTVTVSANGTALGTAAANGTFGRNPGYGFRGDFTLPGTLTPGRYSVCVTAHNLGSYGRDRQVACWVATFDWNPRAAIWRPTQQPTGALVTGWARDPDTSSPVTVRVSADGTRLATTTANLTGRVQSGHQFRVTIPLNDGTHKICVSAVNLRFGSGNSAPACSTVRLNFSPYGAFEGVRRAKGFSTDIIASGWAIDPSTTAPIYVRANVDGAIGTPGKADISRPDVAAKHPGTGTLHGFSIRVHADDQEHRVCARAMNVGNGLHSPQLGCRIINAVHPKVPWKPLSVTAVAGYGGARITWRAPARDGGAPWSSYTVRTRPNGPSVTVGAHTLAATVLGLKPSTSYSFSVVATNVAGASTPGTSPRVTTEKEPPAQTTPAPISTSRYIRNVRGASSTDLAAMRREGAADARGNRSGHAYLVLLAVGGQDEGRQGVVLTAGIRFVSYADMLADLKAYVLGYAGAQQVSAPVTLAVQTNNDIDVSRSSGANFARRLVIPLRTFARQYPGITVAGSDDIEPGFRASYSQTASWLSGFLATTTAPFVFSGSADGCSWSRSNGGCNNGWTMHGMYHLAAGASVRVLALPQIYNETMSQQWRYISLTGVGFGYPRVNFGGVLTEYVACSQARSCGSLKGHTAWSYLWSNLRAEARLRPRSLPYSTDLRIDS